MVTDLGPLGRNIKRVQARHHREADLRLRHLGISIVQWDALRCLHENPGVSLHELAQLTFQTDQSCGALASRLIERGAIERQQGPGRAVTHILTDRGNELRRQAGDIVSQVLEESFAPLNESQREQLAQLMSLLL